MNMQERLAVARGAVAADLVLRHARLVNVFSGAIEETDIVIAGDNVVGFGEGYQRGRCTIWTARSSRPACWTHTCISKARSAPCPNLRAP